MEFTTSTAKRATSTIVTWNFIFFIKNKRICLHNCFFFFKTSHTHRYPMRDEGEKKSNKNNGEKKGNYFHLYVCHSFLLPTLSSNIENKKKETGGKKNFPDTFDKKKFNPSQFFFWCLMSFFLLTFFPPHSNSHFFFVKCISFFFSQCSAPISSRNCSRHLAHLFGCTLLKFMNNFQRCVQPTLQSEDHSPTSTFDVV